MPSGVAPADVWEHPKRHDGIACGIPVTQEQIDAMRAEIPISRDEAFRWVSTGFRTAADSVYLTIGKPELRLRTAWHVFQNMIVYLDNYIELEQ